MGTDWIPSLGTFAEAFYKDTCAYANIDLQWVNLRAEISQENRYPPKPHLLLVPQNIISQWFEGFDRVAPKCFNIYKYFGDNRRHLPIASERTIDGLLTRSHAIFRETESTAKSIVISSYSTFAERHGPSKQKRWRRNEGMSALQAEKLLNIPDQQWEFNLSDCFENMICDEAQHLKDPTSAMSVAAQWVQAKFHVLASATPIPNGINDWLGYMKFIEPLDAETKWSLENLARWGCDEHTDPFFLAGPGAALCFMYRAVKDFVVRSTIDHTTQGRRLNHLWKHTMVRRNLASRIPFNNGPRIGEQLPQVKAALIKCHYTQSEVKAYQDTYKQLESQLITRTQKKRSGWSLVTQRKLTLMTMGLRLLELDAS